MRLLKHQEFELEKMKRLLANKEEESEIERRKFMAKIEKVTQEVEKEREGWTQMYDEMQQEIFTLRHQEDGEQQLSFKAASPQPITSTRFGSEVMYGSRPDPSASEINEQLKTKEEEIKILWNVIKEINKTKGSEKVSVEQL